MHTRGSVGLLLGLAILVIVQTPPSAQTRPAAVTEVPRLQFEKYTLPVMAILYVLLPLPMGLAYFRARFEMEAYEETIRANAELHGVGYVRGADHRTYVIGQFMGPSYGWMWPFRKQLDRWYDRIVATIDGQG